MVSSCERSAGSATSSCATGSANSSSARWRGSSIGPPTLVTRSSINELPGALGREDEAAPVNALELIWRGIQGQKPDNDVEATVSQLREQTLSILPETAAR